MDALSASPFCFPFQDHLWGYSKTKHLSHYHLNHQKIGFGRVDYLPGMISGHLKVAAPDDLDRVQARDLALEAARTHYRQPMLLAWLDTITGRYSPEVECCPRDNPAWVVYAATRGAELAVEVGEGNFFFLFREGAVM